MRRNPHSTSWLFGKRRRHKQPPPEQINDDELKRQWLSEHEPTRLEPGWSRYGYQP